MSREGNQEHVLINACPVGSYTCQGRVSQQSGVACFVDWAHVLEAFGLDMALLLDALSVLPTRAAVCRLLPAGAQGVGQISSHLLPRWVALASSLPPSVSFLDCKMGPSQPRPGPLEEPGAGVPRSPPDIGVPRESH